MAKTEQNTGDVAAFLAAVPDERRRADAEAFCALVTAATGAAPVMWGGNIVGFGSYHYRYASGREGDTMAVGFSPRKAALTLYLSDDLSRYDALFARLGPHTTGKGCVYVKRLTDVDEQVLRELVAAAFRDRDGHTG